MFWKSKPVYRDCPEGSTHAWEFQGTLYDTEEARDKAMRLSIYNRAHAKLKQALLTHYASEAHTMRLTENWGTRHTGIDGMDKMVSTMMSNPEGVIAALEDLQKLRREVYGSNHT